MTALIVAIHVLTCLALIGIVLLQHGKGADMGSAFGSGASQTVFGSRGAGSFLTKLTTGAAVVFMVTSLTLSYFTAPSSLLDDLEETAPAEMVEPLPSGETESSFPEAAPIQDAPSGFEEIPAPPASEPSSEGPAEAPSGGSEGGR
jgi:preprotein translocase subunit SecG